MIILESLAKRIVLTVDRPQRWLKPEVCGKIRTGRPRQVATTRLPAVSLCDKGGVLGGSGICRILSKATIKKPSALSRKAQRSLYQKQSLKRKNRLSAVPTYQAGRTVARPLHSWNFRKSKSQFLLYRGNRRELRLSNNASVKLRASRKSHAISSFLN